MTDAELIYNALLRVERTCEGLAASLSREGKLAASYHIQAHSNLARAIREEIGNGLAARKAQPSPSLPV
jgi:hypothetical protein